MLGAAAPYATTVLVTALYLIAAYMAAKSPDLPDDIDIENPRALDTWPAVKAGLHFLLPIGMLIWCLMIEELSPSLAAFWAIVVLLALMVTQRPLIDFFRGTRTPGALRAGFNDVVHGFVDGSRNMIGIGVATATAGVVVGRDHVDRSGPADDRVRRVRLARQRDRDARCSSRSSAWCSDSACRRPRTTCWSRR